MYAHSLCINIADNFPSPCINHSFCRFVCECYGHEANTVYEMEGKPVGKPFTSSLNICPETCCRRGWGQTGEGVTPRQHPVSQLIHGHLMTTKYSPQGVTKRCRLSWLTNSALVYTSPTNAGGWRVAGSHPMGKAVTWRGAQINFGDLTPYLTYDSPPWCFRYGYAIPIDMQDKCQLQKVSKRGTGRVVVIGFLFWEVVQLHVV